MRWLFFLCVAAAITCGEAVARGQTAVGPVGPSTTNSDLLSLSQIEPSFGFGQPVFGPGENVPTPAMPEGQPDALPAEGSFSSIRWPWENSNHPPLACFSPECWKPNCDRCPSYGAYTMFGYDSWRGVADDSWQNNGLHVGVNFGTRLGRFSDWTGIGFQAGATMGVYNWDGTDYRPSDNNTSQQQGFVTYGFFRRPTDTCHFTGALVQDWMLNDNYGVFSQNPTLSQFRAQLGYALNAWNEIGMWGTWSCLASTRNVTGVGLTTWQPFDQAAFYWHHKWKAFGPDTSIWVGMPQMNRLNGDGSLGDYVVGVSANLPLADWVAVYNVLTYMHASSRPSPAGSEDNAWNFSLGLAFYPGRAARSSTVAGRCWMPLLPVANNGYFLVDTNRH